MESERGGEEDEGIGIFVRTRDKRCGISFCSKIFLGKIGFLLPLATNLSYVRLLPHGASLTDFQI